MLRVFVSNFILVVSKSFKAGRMGAVKRLLVNFLMATRRYISTGYRGLVIIVLTSAASLLRRFYRNIRSRTGECLRAQSVQGYQDQSAKMRISWRSVLRWSLGLHSRWSSSHQCAGFVLERAWDLQTWHNRILLVAVTEGEVCQPEGLDLSN
jgi:hypothetical protein